MKICFSELPCEIIANILSYTDAQTRKTLALVCHRFVNLHRQIFINRIIFPCTIKSSALIPLLGRLSSNSKISMSEFDRGWAVIKAAKIGDETIVNSLLNRGSISEIHRGYAVFKATQKGHERIALILFKSGPISAESRESSIRNASAQGHESLVLQLLASAPIHKNTIEWAILFANSNGHKNIVRHLKKLLYQKDNSL